MANELGLCTGLLEHRLLALQHLQAHVCTAEITAHHQQVIVLRTATIHDILLCRRTERCDADHQSAWVAARIAAHEVHSIVCACELDALVQLVDRFHGKAIAQCDGHRDLLRRGVHGVHIAQVHHHGLIAEVLQRHIAQIEVYSFHEHVRGDHLMQSLRIDHRRIVADALEGRSVLQLHARGDALDKAEFAQGGQFGAGCGV